MFLDPRRSLASKEYLASSCRFFNQKGSPPALYYKLSTEVNYRFRFKLIAPHRASSTSWNWTAAAPYVLDVSSSLSSAELATSTLSVTER
jgi:hypothetical protein